MDESGELDAEADIDDEAEERLVDEVLVVAPASAVVSDDDELEVEASAEEVKEARELAGGASDVESMDEILVVAPASVLVSDDDELEVEAPTEEAKEATELADGASDVESMDVAAAVEATAVEARALDPSELVVEEADVATLEADVGGNTELEVRPLESRVLIRVFVVAEDKASAADVTGVAYDATVFVDVELDIIGVVDKDELIAVVIAIFEVAAELDVVGPAEVLLSIVAPEELVVGVERDGPVLDDTGDEETVLELAESTVLLESPTVLDAAGFVEVVVRPPEILALVLARADIVMLEEMPPVLAALEDGALLEVGAILEDGAPVEAKIELELRLEVGRTLEDMPMLDDVTVVGATEAELDDRVAETGIEALED